MRDPSKPGYKEYAEKYAHILQDPKVVHQAKISSICLFLDEQKWARKRTPDLKTPFMIITGTEDTVVRNSTSRDLVSKITKGPTAGKNHYVEIAGADHTSISVESEFYQPMI